MLVEVRALAGAPLQKLWLPSAQLCVLQLRVPGRTLHAVLDARLGMAALAEERPLSSESAPKSQATLRNALQGARLLDASLRRGAGAPLPWLDFETPQGPRTLLAEHGALLLLAGARIVWASSGAERRPGSDFPETALLEASTEAPLPERSQLVAEALRGEEERGVAARRKQLQARLKARVQKLRRALAAVEEDAARASTAAADQHRAELLLPMQGRIPRGAREARVQDWTQLDDSGAPLEVVLQLDPALSAAANASRWLKKAKRYLAAGERIAARRAQVAAELAAASEMLERAAQAADAAALAALELAAGPAAAPRTRASAAAPRLPYRTFRSGSAAILVGRGARDNDALTLRVARGNDLWLHARGIQGAHVVIPGAGEAPDSTVLGDAALLAVHFSSARDEEGAEVAWTRCKWVRKPKGAKPGAVLVTQEKVLRIRRDPTRLATLLATE